MTKLKFSLAALLLGCACAVTAAAADDSVYVNLSVLDGLGNSSAPAAVSEPLFPIVKKAPAVRKAKVKKTKPAARVSVEVKKPEPQPQTPPQPQPQEPVAEAHQQIPYVQDAEPVVVVDVEPVKAAEPEVKTDNPPVAEATPQVNASSENPDHITVPETAPQLPSDTAAQPTTEPTEPAVAADKSALLIEEPAVPQTNSAVNHNIVFADGVDELTAEQKQQVDAIIASFADASNHKIAIYSYNLDDGVDAFKKKRQSLNRAVAVRSYLLPKGYKNFSIKVVNVDASSGKANTVELEELD